MKREILTFLTKFSRRLPKPEKNEDGENGEEHRHCCCSHHKPDHHNESVEAPKKSDESETKE